MFVMSSVLIAMLLITITNSTTDSEKSTGNTIDNVINHPDYIKPFLNLCKAEPEKQIQHLFSLISNEKLVESDELEIYEHNLNEKIIPTTMENEYYPLYTAFAVEKKVWTQQNHEFRAINPNKIFNFDCIQQHRLEFLPAESINMAIWHTIQTTNIIGRHNLNEYQQEFIQTQNETVKSAIDNIQDHVENGTDLTQNAIDTFLNLVSRIFNVQVIILDVEKTNDDQYPLQLFISSEYNNYEDNGNGTVYLFKGCNCCYHAVIPIESNYEYPIIAGNECFTKTIPVQSEIILPPGVIKQPDIIQKLKEKRTKGPTTDPTADPTADPDVSKTISAQSEVILPAGVTKQPEIIQKSKEQSKSIESGKGKGADKKNKKDYTVWIVIAAVSMIAVVGFGIYYLRK